MNTQQTIHRIDAPPRKLIVDVRRITGRVSGGASGLLYLAPAGGNALLFEL